MSLLMRMAVGGFHLTAPVCSTWVWINRGTSKRTFYDALGDPSVPGNRVANLMVTRVVLTLVLVAYRGGWWVLEQPQGSLLERHPRFKWLCRITSVIRVRIEMKDFGACTAKPSWLYTNCPFLSDVNMSKCPLKTCPQRMLAVQYLSNSGKPSVCGGPDLKIPSWLRPCSGEGI